MSRSTKLVDAMQKFIALRGCFFRDSVSQVAEFVFEVGNPPEDGAAEEERRLYALEKEDFQTRVQKAMSGKTGQWTKPRGGVSVAVGAHKPARFWEYLWNVLPADRRPQTFVELITCTLTDFLGYLEPETVHYALEKLREKRDGVSEEEYIALRHQLGMNRAGPAQDDPGETSRHWSMRMHYDLEVESVLDGVKNGAINQGHYYLNLDAAESWLNMATDGSYRSYRQCKSALESLVTQKWWLDALSLAKYESVIMLGGGGSTTKDMVLISHFAESLQTPFSYTILDISPFLIDDSKRTLNRWIQQQDFKDRVARLGSVRYDFLALEKCDRSELYPRESQNSIWFLTAGTIGNVNESRLMTSLNDRARSGDLFVLAAHIYDESTSISEFEEQVRSSYRTQSMDQFLAQPISSVLSSANEQRNATDVLAQLVPGVVVGPNNMYSKVSCSRTVVWSVDLSVEKYSDGTIPALGADGAIQSQNIVLLTSTRYSRNELEKFVEDKNWERVGWVPSTLSDNFIQLVFRRI